MINRIISFLFQDWYLSKYSQKTTGMVLDECVELKKLNSDLVGVNIDLSQKCVEYSVELARMQEIIQDKAAKIKAQTGQLNYFHS
ncbi:MAG: hypothetical protein OEY89_14150, partial [Gammaproteobacteria bacterium]|nr:hypothetical protein [Gammaproteobacteria bacterium]